MINAKVMTARVWLTAWCAIVACGGGSDDSNSETTTQSNAPPPSNAAPTTPPANQATAAACLPANCPALTLFGSAAAGCCQTNGACGGSIVVMNTPICAPPDFEQVASQFVEPFEDLEQEEIVTVDECAGLSFQGAMLPGCCDPTGVCGVSTEGFAAGNLPFNIPVTCISQADARMIGIVPAAAGADAGAAVACSAN